MDHSYIIGNFFKISFRSRDSKGKTIEWKQRVEIQQYFNKVDSFRKGDSSLLDKSTLNLG